MDAEICGDGMKIEYQKSQFIWGERRIPVHIDGKYQGDLVNVMGVAWEPSSVLETKIPDIKGFFCIKLKEMKKELEVSANKIAKTSQ